MQNHLKAKWHEYQHLYSTVSKMYADKTDIIYFDIVEAMDKKLKEYDFLIQLSSFCDKYGLAVDTIRNLLARLLVSLPEGASYPRKHEPKR